MYEITAAYPEIVKYYGIIAGPAFAFTYSVFGVLMGIAAGKYNRKHILSSTFFLTGVISLLQGSVNSFAFFAIGRMLLGITMSAMDTCCYSLVSDYFSANLRSTAYGVISAGPYLGGGISSLQLMLIDKYGWRFPLKTMGITGIIVSILAFFVIKEPKRYFNQHESIVIEDKPKKRILNRFINALKECYQDSLSFWISMGMMFRYMEPYYFIPSYFLLQFPTFQT